MYNMQGNCWHCGQGLSENDYARQASCSQCGKPTHVCRNCRFFKTGAPSQCSEPMADPVSDKERANFCGYFEPLAQTADHPDDAEALRKAAEDLFKF